MLQNVPPIRLVALDLDGTLLNHEGKVTSRTRAALQAAADRDVAIAVSYTHLTLPTNSLV